MTTYLCDVDTNLDRKHNGESKIRQHTIRSHTDRKSVKRTAYLARPLPDDDDGDVRPPAAAPDDNGKTINGDQPINEDARPPAAAPDDGDNADRPIDASRNHHQKQSEIKSKKKESEIKSKKVDSEIKIKMEPMTEDRVRKEMVRLGPGETLQTYLNHVKLAWTYIDEHSEILSCKFSLQVGSDVQLMVLTNNPDHLERVAIKHYLCIQRHHPSVKLVKLVQPSTTIRGLEEDDDDTPNDMRTWYAVVDPSNLGHFRMVTIYPATMTNCCLLPSV